MRFHECHHRNSINTYSCNSHHNTTHRGVYLHLCIYIYIYIYHVFIINRCCLRRYMSVPYIYMCVCIYHVFIIKQVLLEKVHECARSNSARLRAASACILDSLVQVSQSVTLRGLLGLPTDIQMIHTIYILMFR